MKPEIKLSYQIEGGVDPKEVADVFRRSGIQRPVNDIDQIWRMIRHTDLVICAETWTISWGRLCSDRL